jgi:hypothetical protein
MPGDCCLSSFLFIASSAGAQGLNELVPDTEVDEDGKFIAAYCYVGEIFQTLSKEENVGAKETEKRVA